MYIHSKTTRPSHSSQNNPLWRIAAEHLRHNVCSRSTLPPPSLPQLPCAHHVTSKDWHCLPAGGRDRVWGSSISGWWLFCGVTGPASAIGSARCVTPPRTAVCSSPQLQPYSDEVEPGRWYRVATNGLWLYSETGSETASLIVFTVPCPTRRATAHKRASPMEESCDIGQQDLGGAISFTVYALAR